MGLDLPTVTIFWLTGICQCLLPYSLTLITNDWKRKPTTKDLAKKHPDVTQHVPNERCLSDDQSTALGQKPMSEKVAVAAHYVWSGKGYLSAPFIWEI